MEKLLDYLLIGGVLLIIAWIALGFIHMMLHVFNVWDKIAIEIKLPKRKRYKTKVTPIYQLEESDYTTGGYYIRKWELDYMDEFGLQMLMVFIPYPIKLLRYKYTTKNYIYLGDKTNVLEITEDLGDMFERLWAIEHAKEIEDNRIRKEYQDNLNRINKVFNENYED